MAIAGAQSGRLALVLMIGSLLSAAPVARSAEEGANPTDAVAARPAEAHTPARAAGKPQAKPGALAEADVNPALLHTGGMIANSNLLSMAQDRKSTRLNSS